MLIYRATSLKVLVIDIFLLYGIASLKPVFAFVLPDTKIDTIATYFLNHYIGIFGVPKVLITDNAPYFTSYSWTKFMSFLGIHYKMVTPYHCQSNNLVERFNRYLRTSLRCHDNNDDWFDHLGFCILGIQASYHSVLNMSRAERLFDKKIQLPSSFFDETTPKPRFDDPALTKSLMNFFCNRSPAPINTEKRFTNFHVDKQLLTCSAVYLRVDRVKKGFENSFIGPFKVFKRFDKYSIIETFKGSSKISIDRIKPAYTLDFVKDHKIKSKNNNDSFISSRKKSTSTSAATVTKDSRRQSYENNLYFIRRYFQQITLRLI